MTLVQPTSIGSMQGRGHTFGQCHRCDLPIVQQSPEQLCSPNGRRSAAQWSNQMRKVRQTLASKFAQTTALGGLLVFALAWAGQVIY